MEHKMNLAKSLKNDYFLGLPLIFTLVSAGFLVYFGISRTIDFEELRSLSLEEMISTLDFILLVVFLAVILIGIICFLKRMFYIKSFENEYKTVDAKVVDIHYIKDRCGVDVEFILNGETCKKHFALFNNKQTKYVHMDSEVKLLVKDDDPKKSLILELYFD